MQSPPPPLALSEKLLHGFWNRNKERESKNLQVTETQDQTSPEAYLELWKPCSEIAASRKEVDPSGILRQLVGFGNRAFHDSGKRALWSKLTVAVLLLLPGRANSGKQNVPWKEQQQPGSISVLVLYLLMPMARNLCHSSWYIIQDLQVYCIMNIHHAFSEHLHRNSLGLALLFWRLLR